MSNTSSQPPQIMQLAGDPSLAAAQKLAEVLVPAMEAHQKVAFLLSGGSNLQVYQQLLGLLPADLSLSTLKLGLVDERFGSVGHPDSNEQQLQETRLLDAFRLRGASFHGMLEYGKTGTKLAEKASEMYKKLFDESDQVIVSLGLGEDGHIAGILPMKDSEKFKALFWEKNLVSYYDVNPTDSDNPYQKRLTITVEALQRATQILLYAVGEKKKSALQKYLTSTDVWANQLPVLLLRNLPTRVQLLTDQKLD